MLTVTMSVWMDMSHADLAIFSIQQSEGGDCRKHTTCVRLQSNIRCTIAQ